VPRLGSVRLVSSLRVCACTAPEDRQREPRVNTRDWNANAMACRTAGWRKQGAERVAEHGDTLKSAADCEEAGETQGSRRRYRAEIARLTPLNQESASGSTGRVKTKTWRTMMTTTMAVSSISARVSEPRSLHPQHGDDERQGLKHSVFLDCTYTPRPLTWTPQPSLNSPTKSFWSGRHAHRRQSATSASADALSSAVWMRNWGVGRSREQA